MSNILSRMIGEKKEWKRMEAQANALPRDYRIVYAEMKSYLWRFTTGDRMDIVEILEEILGEFEAAAAAGRHAMDVTGENVAAYCDAKLGGNANPMDRYLKNWRASLNRDVRRQI